MKTETVNSWFKITQIIDEQLKGGQAPSWFYNDSAKVSLPTKKQTISTDNNVNTIVNTNDYVYDPSIRDRPSVLTEPIHLEINLDNERLLRNLVMQNKITSEEFNTNFGRLSQQQQRNLLHDPLKYFNYYVGFLSNGRVMSPDLLTSFLEKLLSHHKINKGEFNKLIENSNKQEQKQIVNEIIKNTPPAVVQESLTPDASSNADKEEEEEEEQVDDDNPNFMTPDKNKSGIPEAPIFSPTPIKGYSFLNDNKKSEAFKKEVDEVNEMYNSFVKTLDDSQFNNHLNVLSSSNTNKQTKKLINLIKTIKKAAKKHNVDLLEEIASFNKTNLKIHKNDDSQNDSYIHENRADKSFLSTLKNAFVTLRRSVSDYNDYNKNPEWDDLMTPLKPLFQSSNKKKSESLKNTSATRASESTKRRLFTDNESITPEDTVENLEPSPGKTRNPDNDISNAAIEAINELDKNQSLENKEKLFKSLENNPEFNVDDAFRVDISKIKKMNQQDRDKIVERIKKTLEDDEFNTQLLEDLVILRNYNRMNKNQRTIKIKDERTYDVLNKIFGKSKKLGFKYTPIHNKTKNGKLIQDGSEQVTSELGTGIKRKSRKSRKGGKLSDINRDMVIMPVLAERKIVSDNVPIKNKLLREILKL